MLSIGLLNLVAISVVCGIKSRTITVSGQLLFHVLKLQVLFIQEYLLFEIIQPSCFFMVLILHLRKDLIHSQNPTDNQIFSARRQKDPKHRLEPAVHVCLSVGMAFKIQGFTPSKALNSLVGKTLWEKNHLQDLISDADPDQRFAKAFDSVVSLGSW